MDKVKGRAYTLEEKKAIINRLYLCWLSSPDLRLGQLIVNATHPDDIFYIEDNALVTLLEKHVVNSL